MQETGVHLQEFPEVHFHQAGHVVPGTRWAPPWNRRGHRLKRYGQGRAGQGRASGARQEGGQAAWTAGRELPSGRRGHCPASRPHLSYIIICVILDTPCNALLWIMRGR